MAGWDTLKGLLKEELKQRTEEGCDTSGFAEKIISAGDDKEALNAVYDELMALEIKSDFPYEEPSELKKIKDMRPKNTGFKVDNKDIDFDFFYGAWLGRCCGCALGRPLEMGHFMGGKDGVSGWELVYEWFKGADAYPVTGYAPLRSTAMGKYGLEALRSPDSTREHIRFMETDDDIRYTVLGLKLLEEKGVDFSPIDIGTLWYDNLPCNMACTAERQAYINFAAEKDMVNASGTAQEIDGFIDFVRTYRNPYREWIGAQIRIDAYAYAAAGRPQLAAELAWKDAAFSHVKNGIYGAMFCAAMIAAAFTEKDSLKIIEAGLGQIPKNCRLTHDIKRAIEITKAAKDQVELVKNIWEAFKHYDPVHTNNNAALCAASILFAGDDFENEIATSVLGGWDTDCNGATVGSIMGAKVGAKNIPDHWSKPLNDTLYSAIPDFHPIKISVCAERSYGVYKNILDSGC